VLGLPETLPPERRRSGGSVSSTVATFRGLAADRVFVGYILAVGLVMGAVFTYVAGAPFVLEDIYGVSPQVFGLLFGANALSIMVLGQLGRLLVGALLKGGLHEYYDPYTGRGMGAPRFAWSALATELADPDPAAGSSYLGGPLP